MKRQVECQSKIDIHTIGTGPTPEYSAENYSIQNGMMVTHENGVASVTEKDEVQLLFYDQHPTAHRNAIQLILTPEEAAQFEVDKVYTLTIE